MDCYSFAALARVSVNQPIDSHLNPGSPDVVFQGVDPLAVDLCFLDPHHAIAAYGLRMSSPTFHNANSDAILWEKSRN